MARTQEEREGGELLNGVREERILEIGGDDSCTIMGMYLISRNSTGKNGYDGEFHVMCILP